MCWGSWEHGEHSDLVVRLLLPGRGVERPLWNDGVQANVGVDNLGDPKVDHAANNRVLKGSLFTATNSTTHDH